MRIQTAINFGITSLVIIGLAAFFVSPDFKQYVITAYLEAERLAMEKLTEMFKVQSQDIANSWVDDFDRQVGRFKAKEP